MVASATRLTGGEVRVALYAARFAPVVRSMVFVWPALIAPASIDTTAKRTLPSGCSDTASVWIVSGAPAAAACRSCVDGCQAPGGNECPNVAGAVDSAPPDVLATEIVVATPAPDAAAARPPYNTAPGAPG